MFFYSLKWQRVRSFWFRQGITRTIFYLMLCRGTIIHHMNCCKVFMVQVQTYLLWNANVQTLQMSLFQILKCFKIYFWYFLEALPCLLCYDSGWKQIWSSNAVYQSWIIKINSVISHTVQNKIHHQRLAICTHHVAMSISIILVRYHLFIVYWKLAPTERVNYFHSLQVAWLTF